MENKKITYEQIEKANETIKTTDIKGKEYAEVNQRIKAFRMVYPNGAIIPEMLSNENGIVIFKATIYDEEGNVIGVGHAYECEGSTFINKTSYIENCETSAVGRALGMCGFGIDTSVASAEEVANAIINQENDTKKQKQTTKKVIKNAEEIDYHKLLQAKLKEMNINIPDFAKRHKLSMATPQEEVKDLLEKLMKGEIS